MAAPRLDDYFDSSNVTFGESKGCLSPLYGQPMHVDPDLILVQILLGPITLGTGVRSYSSDNATFTTWPVIKGHNHLFDRINHSLAYDRIGTLVLCQDNASASLTANWDENEVTEFLHRLRGLSNAGQKENAIDLVFYTFDSYQNREQFSICDQIIGRVVREALGLMPTLLVSFLTITLAAKDKFRNRPLLYSVTTRIMKSHFGEARAQRILVGLE
jgi:hypothetical protein